MDRELGLDLGEEACLEGEGCLEEEDDSSEICVGGKCVREVCKESVCNCGYCICV